MINIAKNEALALRKILNNGNVVKTYSKHPKYYLVESRYNIAQLNRLRNSKIVKQY